MSVVIGMAVIVAAVWVWAGREKGDFEVISGDGKVKMTIAREALPKGVAARDLRIETVSDQDEADVFVYKLMPDGLVLAQPATVTATFEDRGQVLPLALHYSGNSLVPLESVEVWLGGEENQTIISAEMAHFSALVILLGYFDVGVTGPPDFVKVGDFFPVRVKVRHTGKTQDYRLETGTETTTRVKPPWTVEGELTVEQTGTGVGPTRVANRPPLTQAKELTTVVAEETFFCQAEAVSARVIFTGTLTGELESVFTVTAEEHDKGASDFRRVEPFEEKLRASSNLFECFAPPSPSPKASGLKRTEDTGGGKTDSGSGGQEAGMSMEVLVINGKNFPALQFRTAGADECDAEHYHADVEVSSVDLTTHLNDPNPSGCGFGKVSGVVKKTVSVTKEQAEVWQ